MKSTTQQKTEIELCPICGGPKDACVMQSYVFDVEHLCCAHCAAKMEESIALLPEVETVTLAWPTKQLRVTCTHPQQRREQFQKICQNYESEVTLVEHVDKRGSRGAQSSQGAPALQEAASTQPGTDFPAAAEPGATAVLEASAQKDSEQSEMKKDLTVIIVSALLFISGLVAEHAFALEMPSTVIYLLAYLVAGVEIFLKSGRNISHGKIFDENFLMTIASIGAIVVQQFPEAVGVMLFYRVGELFEDRAVAQSRSQIMEAVDMRPETVERLLDFEQIQSTESLPVQTDTANDVHAPAQLEAQLEAAAHGAQAPVNGLSFEQEEFISEVIDAADAAVGDFLLIKPGGRIPLDGRVMKGKSRIDTSPVTGENVPVSVTAGSELISGCVNTSGLLVERVEKELSDSMVTRILNSVENAAASKPKIQRFITRFASIYTPIVIGLAAFCALVPSLITGNWPYWVYTACTFLVISCPCAIVLSIPLSFFAGIGAASKLGILFKGGNTIEALKNVRTVIMDKTGTITRGVFTVQRVCTFSDFTADEALVFAAGAEAASTHPIALSIQSAVQQRGLSYHSAKSVEELAGKGIIATVSDGTKDHEVLCGNEALLDKRACKLPTGFEFAEDTGATTVFVAIDGRVAAQIYIADEPKADSAQAIVKMRSRGVQTVMLTGDTVSAAQAVARELGIDKSYARLLPDQKFEKLKKIREKSGAVMFVGDGINDAPVLAGADVGAAMASGSDAALEAADIVFMNSNLMAVPQAMSIAKVVARIATQNITFALIVKISVMILGLVGFASMWAAVFADVGVAVLCILNSVRILYKHWD